MTILTAGDSEGLSLAGFGRLAFAIGIAAAHPKVITARPSLYEVSDVGWTVSKFYGIDLSYDAAGHLNGGVVTRWEAWGPTWDNPSDAMLFSFAGLSIPATTVEGWLLRRDGPESEGQILLLGGDDSIAGGVKGDYLVAFAGNDSIAGGAGDDFLQGGYSSIDGSIPSDPLQDGANVLRGGEGNDGIAGGAGFDDINGNQGNDTASGQNGGDWVVGGQGDDLLSGDAPYIQEAADDIVLGNLGNDTCSGDGGNDTVRGGQGDDMLYGGVGDDFVSGDRGNDTLAGGDGADTFHFFPGAGHDRVTDFSYASGDLVYFDPPGFSFRQIGADVVITLETGDSLTLVGVSNLPDDFFYTSLGRYRSTTPGDDVIRAGSQADIIPSSGGFDRVVGFSYASGDRLLLGYDETYSVAQVGPDAVAAPGSGGQILLVGVSLADLPEDWIQRKGVWDY